MKRLWGIVPWLLLATALGMMIGPGLLTARGPKEIPAALTSEDVRLFIAEALRAQEAYTDTALDTARTALANAATATDSAATAMDTALAAYDTVLGAGLPYVTAICDTTGDTVQVKALLVSQGICINFDGPDGNSYLYFYDNAQKKHEFIGWIDATTTFQMSSNVYISGTLETLGDLKVNGKDIDIGDAGGFSGIKFNPTSTELEFWIDGSKVGSIGEDGVYDDEVP